MGNMTFVESAINKKLMDMHCGYIGRVISTDGSTATVQPLGMIKEIGGAARAQAIVANVPVACRYKFKEQPLTYVTGVSGNAEHVEASTNTITVAVPVPLAAGDLVACLCADRDISEARRGNNALPPAGKHSISDSIIVGIL